MLTVIGDADLPAEVLIYRQTWPDTVVVLGAARDLPNFLAKLPRARRGALAFPSLAEL
jgi:hypothetical protein